MLKWSNEIVNQHFQSASKQMVPSDEMPNHRVRSDDPSKQRGPSDSLTNSVEQNRVNIRVNWIRTKSSEDLESSLHFEIIVLYINHQ